MKRLLLPTDFSENSKLAIRYGLSLLEGETYVCTLLHALPTMFTPSEIPLYSEEMIYENAEDSQNELIRDLREIYQGRGFHFKSVIENGNLTEIIDDLEEDDYPDLLIMGTRGDDGKIDLLLGSNTSSVIRKVHCPVLVVPYKSEFRKPKKIVFAVDLKYKLNNRLLSPLLDIAKRFDAEILILQVMTDSETANDAANGLWISHYLDKVRHSFHSIHDKNIPEGIDRFTEQHKASLVAVIPGHRNFIERIFHKSVTKSLALHIKTPLLVLNE